MSGVDAGLLALGVVLLYLAIAAWIMAMPWAVRELARVIVAAARPVRIRWHLVRDLDADLMLYRGWSTDELEREYFKLRIMKLLGEEAVLRAMDRLSKAIVAAGISIAEAAEAFQKATPAYRRVGRYPMDGSQTDGTP